MERFVERHADDILGTLSGFDRVLFRGTLRSIAYLQGMDVFLSCHKVLYKDFGRFAEKLSTRLKEHARQIAVVANRPYRHLHSASESKEDIARGIMEKDGVRDGLICVLACVEPCRTFSIRKNRDAKMLDLEAQTRQCLHVYFYYNDREFGLMHVRLQTWLPFGIQVCLNGREYLAKQLDHEKIGYEQRDNCFVAIDDLPRAQKLLQRLETRKWAGVLKKLAQRVNPLVKQLDLFDYYWTFRQAEYATDVMFRSEASLQKVYLPLVHHAVCTFDSKHVMRFLGRHTNSRFSGEVISTKKHRPEGICVKHQIEENSMRMYDKQGRVLRVETTINNPRRYRVYRRVERNGRTCMAWLPMRKGLADLRRRVEISQAANQRYLQTLSQVEIPQRADEVLDKVSKRITRKGRPYRALRPITKEETTLFRVLLDGKFAMQGFRNKDVRQVVFADAEPNEHHRRRAAGRVTRLFRLLRAHGVIRKIPHTTYYRTTPKGVQLMTTAIRLRQLNMHTLAA